MLTTNIGNGSKDPWDPRLCKRSYIQIVQIKNLNHKVKYERQLKSPKRCGAWNYQIFIILLGKNPLWSLLIIYLSYWLILQLNSDYKKNNNNYYPSQNVIKSKYVHFSDQFDIDECWVFEKLDCIILAI